MSDNAPSRPSVAQRLTQIVGEDCISLDEPMSEHTTFEIGGPADVFVTPATPEAAADAIAVCREEGVPFFVLGRGSDLLVSDLGYRGVIVCMADALDDLSVEDERLVCQAGVTLYDAAEAACALGLTGLEFSCGIPGTVGGAVFMNAGAYGGQIADVLESVDAIDADGNVVTIPASELDLGYRHSRVADEGLFVLSATFSLKKGDEEKIRVTMDELTEKRSAKQPLELPSAGSTFKRPEGHFAGKLISDAGLQGYRVGGAEVSTKHAGFVVNADGATAADVRAVIAHVQDEVECQFGVRLEPEVRFLGEF